MMNSIANLKELDPLNITTHNILHPAKHFFPPDRVVWKLQIAIPKFEQVGKIGLRHQWHFR